MSQDRAQSGLKRRHRPHVRSPFKSIHPFKSFHVKVFSRFRSFSVQEIDNDGKLLSLRDLASSVFENLCFVLVRLKKWPNCVQAGEGRRVTPCSEDKRCVTSQIRVP